MAPARKRRVSLRLIGLVVGLLALLWQKDEIAFRFNLLALQRSETPKQSWMRELGARDERAIIMLRRLWNSGRVAHRRAVVDYLRGEHALRPGLIGHCTPMLMEAAHDPDHSLRELLLSGLKMAKLPAWRDFALLQLDDADPAIKVYAMTYLRTGRVTNALSRISRLIDDRDLGVQFSAAVTIEAFADEDFGLEPWMGMKEGKERDAAFNRIRVWWEANKESFPGAEPGAKKVVARKLPELNFMARDHRPVSSLAWRGKPTFVQFFTTYCASCDQVLLEVQKLSQRLATQPVNVVGVSLDAIPDDHNHFFDVVEVEGHEGHGHHHGHGNAHHKVDSRAIMEASWNLLVPRRLGFKVLYDVTGDATSSTDGGEIPVGVFLDAEGRLMRRFVGPRSASALFAMLRADFPEAIAGGGEEDRP